MRLEFDYTIDDLKEAYAAHQPKPSKHVASAARTTGILFFVITSFVTLILLAFSSRDSTTVPARPTLLDLAMPVIVLALLLTPWVTYRSLKVTGVRGTLRNRAFVGAVGWLVAAGLLVVLWRMLSRAAAINGEADTAADVGAFPWRAIIDFLIPHLTWLFLLAGLFVLLLRQTSQQLLATWNGSPTLHRRHTLTLADDGLTLADPVSRWEAKWLVFDRVIETRNLFVLYVGEHSFHMVPKRAFADAAQLDAFRAALDDRIAHRPAAFPVLPVAG